MDERYRTAVKFFKENRKYHRILKEIAEKYRSRGTLGGTIEIHNLTEEERFLLCKIDSKYIRGQNATFTVKKFLKTFENTELAELDFLQILHGYFGGEIKTHKDIREMKANEKEQYFAGFLQGFEGTEAGRWLEGALNHKKYGYMTLVKEYEGNKEALKDVLLRVMEAVSSLESNSKELLRLAIFSSMQTKDPHYFDTDRLGGKLLLSALAYRAEMESPKTAEEQNELLYHFGILKDEISNYTTVSSIEAYTQEGVHRGIEGFHERVEPIQLNLWNLSRIQHIQCRDRRIFVFENPTVFSEVLERTQHRKPTLLCTSGQLKLASIILLDKLVDQVDKIYYAGDFDPEGIRIAYRLKQRYGEKLELWRYDVGMYHRIKSTLTFDEKRWEQLKTIEEPKLKQLIAVIEKERVCGYQELLIEAYVEDIMRLVDDSEMNKDYFEEKENHICTLDE